MAGVPRHHRGRPEAEHGQVHLFPTPGRARRRSAARSTDHDLADHPVWPVVAGLGAADLTPDDDHRYDLDGVYDIAAENPDRWAVEELAATIDIVSRLAECLDTTPASDDDEDDDTDDDDERPVRGRRRARRPPGGRLAGPRRRGVRRPLRRGLLGRRRRRAGRALGGRRRGARPSTWTGPAPAARPSRTTRRPRGREEATGVEDLDEDLTTTSRRSTSPTTAGPGATAPQPGRPATAGTSTHPRRQPDHRQPRRRSRPRRSSGRPSASCRSRSSSRRAPGVTLRCYVEDAARFLGRDGEIFLFADARPSSPASAAGDEDHDLTEIASWPEVADTDTLPLPAEQDRYDLTELTEVLAEVADGAAGPGRPPGLRPAGRGRPRHRGVRRAAAGRGAARPPTRRWAAPSPAASASPTRPCAPRTPRCCARVGPGRHRRQRRPGLPGLTQAPGRPDRRSGGGRCSLVSRAAGSARAAGRAELGPRSP